MLSHANRDELWNLPSGAVSATRFWDVLTDKQGSGLAIVDYFYCPTPNEYPRAILFQNYRWLEPIRSPVSFFSKLPNGQMIDAEQPTAHRAVQAVLDARQFRVLALIQRHTDFLQHQGFFFYLVNHLLRDAGPSPVHERLVQARMADAQRIVLRYQAIDRQLGEILDHYPEDYLFVVSDHGFKANPPQVYIDLSESARNAWNLPDDLQQATGDTTWTWRGQHFRVAWRWQREAMPLLRDPVSGRRIYFTVAAKEIVFTPINDGGAAVLQLREFLAEGNRQSRLGKTNVLELKPSGTSLVLRVAPLVRALGLLVADLETIGTVSFNYASNCHDRDDSGVFFAAGPGIARDKRLENLTLFDVTPTLLYLKGQPIGRDMIGRVITEMIDPKTLTQRPINFVPTLDTPEFLAWRRQLRQTLPAGDLQSLRSLGYLQ